MHYTLHENIYKNRTQRQHVGIQRINILKLKIRGVRLSETESNILNESRNRYMKKSLLLTLGLLAVSLSGVASETVELNGKDYTVNTLIDRDLGPGVRYTRLRVEGYPLNVNMLRIDVTNPYNSVEVQQGQDKLYSTESLVAGAKRHSTTGHVALAGANANFWCVSGQPPYSDQLIGVTYNGNLKNGKIITETNCKNDKYNGGLKHTGITGISVDKKVYSSNQFQWEGWVSSDATGDLEIFQCNKIVRDGELGLYNSFYPTSRTFRCVDQVDKSFNVVQNCATEVYLSMDEGEKWSAGENMTFTVKDVKTNAGNGTLGNYDLALVGRGDYATALAKLKSGDKVTVRYNWIAPDGSKIVMNNLVGGNAQVMVNGELTTYNDSENYNSQVYSRTGYGTDSEGKTLYIVVIDKATDPLYGTSAGCPTKVMCQLAKHYGCMNMTNFDAGGSAMMMVGDQIINKTTEGSPRAVANGMVAFSTAPEDNVVTRLEFYDYELKSPVYATSTPRIIAYNQYGAVISDNFTDAVLSCPAEVGTCDGNIFSAGGQGIVSTITATYNNISVTKPITIVESELALRIKPILIDYHRTYPLEVTANVDGNVFIYDPASINWTISDSNVININEKGELTGLTEGTSELTGTIGDFNDNTIVTVQESPAPKLAVDGEKIDADTWKCTYSSTKEGKLTPKGTNSGFGLDFNITATRSPKITVAKDIDLYSLPDAIELSFNPGELSVTGVTVSLQPATESRPVAVTKSATYETSKENTILIPISEFADDQDLASYPIKFKSIAFSLSGSTGSYHIDVNSIKAVYNNYNEGVSSIEADGNVNGTATRYYDLRGIEVNVENLTPGIYIRVANGETTKVIIK